MTRMIAFLAATLAILASTIPAEAQQAGKVYRIGWLSVSRINPAFPQGLRELGYVEGKNLTIEFRQRKRSKPFLVLAKELVRLKVDLIVAVGIGAASAAKQATSTIPIVMGNSSADPVQHGLIDSLARPGGNVTGVIDLLPDLAGKRVELLKEISPKLSRIAHLSPEGSGINPVGRDHLKATEAAARGLGVQVQALNAGWWRASRGRWMTRPRSCTGVLWYSPDTGERRVSFQAQTRAKLCGQESPLPEVP